MGTKTTPTHLLNKAKWDNKNDSTCGLIRMPISYSLTFKELRPQMILGKSWMQRLVHIMTFDQLKNQLVTLDRNNFSCIAYFLSKFKILKLLLLDCRVKKEDPYLIYAILSKLGLSYCVCIYFSVHWRSTYC